MPETALLPNSLKFRMTGVVILLVLAATVIVTSVALALAERDMKSVIGNQQYALLSSAAAQVDSQLAAKRILLATLAEAMPPALAADTPQIQAFIARHPTARKEFLNLDVYDVNGGLRHSTATGAAGTPLNDEQRAIVRRTASGKQGLISAPFKVTVSGLPVILITEPVLDASGRVVLVLGGSIDLVRSAFLEQIGMQKPGKTGFMFIMTSTGILVHHPNKARLLENINARPGYNRATEMALRGFEGWTEAANKDGSQGIYTYKRIRSTNWVLGARYPSDEALAPMIEMRRQAVLAATAFAAVAGLVGWLVIRLLLRPLTRLRLHISDIRKGRASIAVLQRGRHDEIGELSTAFHVLMAEREAAQQSISDSESLIRSILERAPDAFVSCDTEGRVTEWNAQAEATFGWSRAEAVGRDVAELIIPDNHRAAHREGMRRFAAVGAGPMFNTRVRLTGMHRDGRLVPVEISIGAVRHGSQNFTTAFLHDVTERVRHEQQIAASERRARMIADSMPAMIAYVDRDLRYRFTNEYFRDLMGVDPKEMLGKSIGEVFGQELVDILRPYIDSTLAGERVHYEREGLRGGRHSQLMVDMIPDLAADGSVAGFYLMALDITERKDAELAQAANEKRLKLLTDNLPVLISYLDQERRFRFVNATFFAWFGVSPESLIGRPLVEGIGQEHYLNAEEHLEQAYRGQIVTYELKARMSDSVHTLETTFVPDIDADGQVVGIYSLTHDTTRMKEIEERLTQLARIDTLTGIANRLMFEEILQLAIGRTRRNRKPMALAYLDVDNFKTVNDTQGHGAGDIVLKEFASRLVGNVRAVDTVARLAGDEFVIIFEQVNNVEEAGRLAGKLVAAVRGTIHVDGHALNVTTSIGVALHHGDEETAAELVARADTALYAAKRNGRDGYVVA